MTGPHPWLCLVSSRRAAAPGARTLVQELEGLERQLSEAIDAGVDLIQIREPDLPASTLRDLTRRLVRRSTASTRLVVNDRADVALAAGAAGVHLRGDGPPVAAVRSMGPRGWLVGRSVHAAAEAASAGGPDYLIFGTVFDSRSKGGRAVVVGLGALRAAAAASTVPTLAIGGVTVERAADCRAAGAAGVAAIGVFLPRGSRSDALGPAEAVRRLREAWHDAGPVDVDPAAR